MHLFTCAAVQRHLFKEDERRKLQLVEAPFIRTLQRVLNFLVDDAAFRKNN
jgi:hypothetical protein